MSPKAEGQDEFIEFWQRTCNRVRAYMFCACHNFSDADDLTQDCFMRALRSWSAFQGMGSRQAWLFAIARSTQVDWFRKEHRQKRASEERPEDEGRAVAMDPNGDNDLSDHLDVINMSLGSGYGGANDSSAAASDNAAAAGVIVVNAAGCGSAYRSDRAPDYSGSAVGFRVCRTASVPGGSAGATAR